MRNFLFLCLLCYPFLLLGQTYLLSNETKFELLAIKDGLPANSANAIIQDRDGFIWIGSFGGLSRYDGYKFKTYQYEEATPDSSLVNNYIRALYEDKDGFIWIGTMVKGLQRFDPATETFITYPSGTLGIPGIMDQYITTIQGDDFNNIWVGTTNGLYRLSSPNGTYQPNDIDLVHFSAKAYPDTLLQVLSKATDSKAMLAGMLKVGNNQDLIETFSLEKPTTVLIAGSGEYGGIQNGMIDFGTLRSADGEVIWNMDVKTTSVVPNIYNRSDHPLNRIKVTTLDLDAGDYTIHYHSNDKHHADQWQLSLMPAPYNMSKGEILAYPNLWGIQVFAFDTSELIWLKDQLQLAKSTQVVSGSSIMDIHIDEQAAIWVASSGGIDKLTVAQGKYNIEHLQASHQHVVASKIDFANSIYARKNGELLIYGNSINPTSKEYELIIETIPNNQKPISSILLQSPKLTEKGMILEDVNGTIWLTSHTQGLYRLVSDEIDATSFQLEKYLFTNNYTEHLFEDDSGVLWIGVWKDGVYQLKPSIAQFKFKSILNDDNLRVTRLKEDANGNIYIGTKKRGLFFWDKQQETILPVAGTSAINGEIVGIVIDDARKNVWLGTNSMGLLRYDLSSKKITKHFPDKTLSEDANIFRTIVGDQSGNIWISTMNRIYYYDIKTNKSIYYPELSKNLSQGAEEMLIDKSGNLVLSGNLNGLHYLKRSSQKPYLPTTAENYLNNGIITSMAEAPITGNLWLAYNNRLVLMDKDTKILLPFRSKQLPESIKISRIVADTIGHLWLSTPKGIAKFTIATGDYHLFGVNNGIFLDEFLPGPSLLTTQGNLLVGGKNGVYHFNPTKVQANEIPPKVKIIRLAVQSANAANETTSQPLLMDVKRDIILAANQNIFEINYVGLHFDKAKDIQYAYRMLGLNEEWIAVGKERNARFNNLPPGQYTFQVIASNGDGVWNETGAKINIDVLSPWWQTYWAFTFYTIIILGSILGIYQNQINRIKLNNQLVYEQREAERLEQLNTTKDRLFAIISHDLRKPALAFRGISKKVKFLIQQRKFEDLDKYGTSLENSAYALNSLLDNLLNWALQQRDVLPYNPAPINVAEVTQEIYDLFHQMAADKNIHLKMSIPESTTIFADLNAYATIVRNLIDNAIKYTPEGGTIDLSAEKVAEKIVIKVADTGTGISPGKIEQLFDLQQNKSSQGTAGEMGSGLGLTLVKDLVALNKGTIKVESVVAKGTTFEVLLPAA